jgi:hypothetical protein
MQLGRYPNQVPSQFLLPPSLYDSEAPERTWAE